VDKQISSLAPNDLLIWVDWKANWTLPLRHVPTGDAYWAQSRREVICLGIVCYKGQVAGPALKTGIVFLSDIIDHTCLAACAQLLEVKKRLGSLAGCKTISFWFDCGPHYRCVDLLSHLGTEWVKPEKRDDLHVTCNYFGGKNGKGQCDSLFICSTWVRKALMVPDASLESSDGLLRQTGAEQDMVNDPPSQGGMRYLILKWDQDRRPTHAWKGEVDEFQIKKSYCIHMQRAGPKTKRFVRYRDGHFSDYDRTKAVTFSLQADSREIAPSDAMWRRGYYMSTRWKRSFPEDGGRNTLIEQESHLSSYEPAMAAAQKMSNFERKIARYEANLARQGEAVPPKESGPQL
jgi:hypothetical protein